MKIIEIHLLLRDHPALRAFATATFDSGRVFRGLKVIEGPHGIFLDVPRSLKPVDPEIRARLEQHVLAAYLKATEAQLGPSRQLASSCGDRVRGVLLGLAAGDRIGGPMAMALRVAESLLSRSRFDEDDLFARYLDWWRNGAFDSGPTAARTLALVDSGVDRDRATASVHDELRGKTAGCNPPHRCAPLAMCSTLEDELLADAARAEAALTHYHPLTGEVSAAVVTLCRLLIRGIPWENAVERAAAGRTPETRSAIELRNSMTASRGGFALVTLHAALYFLEANLTFGEALGEAIEFAGPANYCPVLVGSIGGARWGARQVDLSEAVHPAALLDRARAAADALAAPWEEPRARRGTTRHV